MSKTIREVNAERLIKAGGKIAAKQSSKYLVIDFSGIKVLLGKSGAFRISRSGKLTESGSVTDPDRWMKAMNA